MDKKKLLKTTNKKDYLKNWAVKWTKKRETNSDHEMEKR